MERGLARREISLGALPWVIFAVVGRNAGQGTAWASACALLTIVVVGLPMLRWRSVRVWQASGFAIFSVLLVWGLIAGDERANFINQYGRALAFGGLALTALISLFNVAFTEEYTRDAVRPKYWHTPRFHAVNRFITTAIMIGFTLISVSFVVAQLLDPPVANTVFNWVVPIVLAVATRMISQAHWNTYYEEHVSASDDAMHHIAVLDTLFMTPAREREVRR
jgi:hypothetical protein